MKEVDEDGFAIRTNKTEQKRQMAALQKAVVQLIDARDSVYSELNLSDAIVAGLKQARGMKTDSARKRLVKHITKQISQGYAPLVLDYFDEEGARQLQDKQLFHDLEKWRGKLIDEGDAALQEYLGRYPEADRQQLRQVVRAAQKERDNGKSLGASKKLFKILREIAESG